jgi:hypothetical protein
VSIAQTNFKGRSAIQAIAAPEAPNAASYAVVKDVSFRDGTIEVDVAGQPAAGAGGGARGFIGIAFRLQGDGAYDQVRRNHSTQYDLKLEPRAGGVALWVGPGTEGYFSNLKITSR